MSDKESSSSDMECDDVTEGATVRVVQSSMHASIQQNSLFRVVENKKESDEEDQAKDPPPSEPIKPEQEEEKKEEPALPPQSDPLPEPVKIEEKPESPPQEPPAAPTELKPESKPQESPEKAESKAPKQYSKAVMKILSDPKPKKIEKLDVDKRFYTYQEKVNKKIQSLQEAKDKELLEVCTFTPAIKKKSEKRAFDQFLRHVNNFEKNKKDRIERSRKEQEDEIPKKSSFKPTLSEKTIRLTKSLKPETAIHERLYKEFAVLKTKQEQLVKDVLAESCTFKPKVESNGAKREGDTRIRLYEMSKEKKNAGDALVAKPKLIDESSENMIQEKYLKKIDEVLPLSLARDSMKSPDGSQKPPEDSKSDIIKLSQVEFINLLVKLKFIHEQSDPTSYTSEYELASKAWAWLGGDQGSTIDLEKIKSFILDILTLNHSIKSHKIHVEFLKFYHNQQEPSPRGASSQFTPSFKPEIDHKSQKLAAIVNETRASNMGNKKIEHVLYNLHQEKLKKLEQRRKTLEMFINPECTFQPQTTRGPKISEEEFKDSASLSSDYLRMLAENKMTRNEVLYNFNKLKVERKEKIQRTSEDWEYERNMGECSFVPDLDKPKFDLKVKEEARGAEEAIDRVRKVREERKSEVSFPQMKFGLDLKSKAGK